MAGPEVPRGPGGRGNSLVEIIAALKAAIVGDAAVGRPPAIDHQGLLERLRRVATERRDPSHFRQPRPVDTNIPLADAPGRIQLIESEFSAVAKLLDAGQIERAIELTNQINQNTAPIDRPIVDDLLTTTRTRINRELHLTDRAGNLRADLNTTDQALADAIREQTTAPTPDTTRAQAPVRRSGPRYEDTLDESEKDIAKLPQDMQDYLRGARDQVFHDPNPNNRPGVQDVQEFQNRLEGMARNHKGNDALNPEQTRALANIKEKFNEKLRAWQASMREEQEIPNTITLTQREAREIERDPIGAIDKMMGKVVQQIIEDPESPAAQTALRRLELKLNYLLTDEYDVKRLELVMDNETLYGTQAVDRLYRVRSDIERALGDQKDEFLAQHYTIPLHLAKFHEAFSNASDLSDQRFQGFINSMSERDFFGPDTLYGGLVGRAKDLLVINYQKLLAASRSQA